MIIMHYWFFRRNKKVSSQEAKNPNHFLPLLLLLVIAVSGCTAIREQGLSVALQADPPLVFSKSSTTLHIDIDNRQGKSIRNIVVELFDTGLLEGRCAKTFDRLLRYEFQSMACLLGAPSIAEQAVETEVNVRAAYDSELSATHVFEVIDENEYLRRAAVGSYEQKPRSYAYSDKNVMVDVEFSEDLPLVIRPGKKYFAYFTITNIGNGFISNIMPGDFSIENDNILDCPSAAVLSPVGKTFPRIACEIKPQPSFLLGDARNTDFLMTLNYRYEVRNSLRINVIR